MYRQINLSSLPSVVRLVALVTIALNTNSATAKDKDCRCKPERLPGYIFVKTDGKKAFALSRRLNAEKFSDGLLRATSVLNHQSDAPCNYLDSRGKIVLKNVVGGSDFRSGLATFISSEQIGFISQTGEVKIAPIFSEAGFFHDNRAPVKINGNCGFIDPTGQFVIAPFFTNVAYFSEGLAAAEAQGKIGFIDTDGHWKIKPTYTRADGFFGGVALVTIGKNAQFIDKSGTVIKSIPKEAHWTSDCGRSNFGLVSGGSTFYRVNCWNYYMPDEHHFAEGLTPFSEGVKLWGFVDNSGKFAITPQYREAAPFSDGLARVLIDGKYGFIDKTGKIVIEPRFSRAEDFSEQRAAVAIGHHKWGHIDTSGKVTTPLKYARTESFSDGLAKVQNAGEYKDGLK